MSALDDQDKKALLLCRHGGGDLRSREIVRKLQGKSELTCLLADLDVTVL